MSTPAEHPSDEHAEAFAAALRLTGEQIDATERASHSGLYFTTLERFVTALGGHLAVRITFDATPDETVELAPAALLRTHENAELLAQMIRGMDEEARDEREASQHTTAPGTQTEQHAENQVRPDAPPVGAAPARDHVPASAVLRHLRALLLRWAAGLEEGFAWLADESVSDETWRHARATITGCVRGVVGYLDGPQTAGLPANLERLLGEAFALGIDEEGVWHDGPLDVDRETARRRRASSSAGDACETSGLRSC